MDGYITTAKRWATLRGGVGRNTESFAFSQDGNWFGASAIPSEDSRYVYMWNVAKLFEKKQGK
jgi:hypothetical protein